MSDFGKSSACPALTRALFAFAPSAVALTLFAACGSRTGLLVPEETPGADAAIDQVVHDAPTEADGPVHKEAGLDAGLDAPRDAPLDVQFRDVPVIDICPDAGSTLVYLLSADNSLWSFYPPTLALTSIGLIACGDGTSGPFSMAVDRRGIAYSVFNDGNLFRVDTASAACLPTTYQAGQLGFLTFGMGFVANVGDAGETLFVDEANASTKGNSLGLATIDVTTYVARFTGNFIPSIPGAELTGTSDGRLYAFFTNATGSGSHIVELDEANAAITTDYPLQVGSPSDGYAFAFWGGVFWVFTSSGSGTQVTRFDPTTKTETPMTNWATEIVGAGVSTCAPQ